MIKQFVPQEVCLKCQGCCRFSRADSLWAPCLLDEEIQVLLDTEIPPAMIDANKRVRPVQNPGKETEYICAFLEAGSNKCRIYALRPFECQLYPFLINLRQGKVILTVDLNCHYVRDAIKRKEFKDYVGYLEDFLNSPEQIQLLKNNPQIIQAYEDVSDIVELKINDKTE